MEEFLFTINSEDSVSDDTNGNSRRSSADLQQEQLWDSVTSLYSTDESSNKDVAALNENPISPSRVLNGDAGSTAQQLDTLLDAFMNGANTCLEELTVLGNSHPALTLTIFAFHEVVKLDIARRDNNKKALVVVMQMQNMLGPIFQLRNLDHIHMSEAEKQLHEDRLKEIAEVITRDIKMCRSDITHFMNRKFVYKLILAKGYEKKFAGHIETFALRRSELQSVISEYISVGITTANIAQIGKQVNFVDTKIDKIISVLFRNLDTPRERDVFKFMQQNGGPEKCVNDLDLLPKLISKAGESPKTGKAVISDQSELEELQKALSEALKEDLDKVLEKHYSRFEKVLQVQSNNLKRMSAHLEDQGVLMQMHTTKLGKILDTVTTIMVLEEGKFRTKSVKLKDPEIQRVWNQMNLTTNSVKAKVFVLTFRDHIRVENSGINTPVQGYVSLPTDSDALQPNFLNTTVSANTMNNKDSEWVLEYIDVAYVQPIVEAMDEDGSGFISVKEANNFALARPKDINLLHWIAYWAAGWHINLIQYQKDIYSILLQMHEAVPSIHVANRAYVDDFLDQSVMRRIEAVLRSIKPLPDISKKDPNLLEVARTVASWQLERLKTNLSDMGFVIESPFDAMTISGSARVETWILPLLLLLLQRLLDIVRLSETIVLDPMEFASHITSLTSIFSVFDERMENLEAKFRQLHRDIDAQFSSFSYGMFYAAFKKIELDASVNYPLTLKADEYISHQEIHSKPGSLPDISILSKPPGKLFVIENIELGPSGSPPSDYAAHPMEGSWFGWFSSENGCIRPHRCFIHPIIDNKFAAKSEAFFGTIDLIGIANVDVDNSTTVLNFEFLPRNPEYCAQICEGLYDPIRDTITGTYQWKPDDPPNTDASEVTKDPETVVDEQSGSIEAIVEPEELDRTQEPIADELASKNDQIETNTDVPGEEKLENRVEENPSNKGELHSYSNDITEASTHANELPSSLEPSAETLDENPTPEDQPNPPEHLVTEFKDEEPIAETVITHDSENRRLFLTRTPPHAFRFRQFLDGPAPIPCWTLWPLARKQWAFATEAVLSEVRTKMGSAKAFEVALVERRRWIYHAMRYDLTEANITPDWYRFASFTDTEWDVYDALITTVNPSMALIYEEISHYMARRETYIVGRVFCDSCTYRIAFIRHQCIICIEEDLSDGIDLCQNCFTKSNPVRSGNKLHTLSHPLLRSKHRVHKYESSVLIPEARLISERSKKLFRELEEAKKEENERTGNTAKAKGSRKFRSERSLLKRLTPVEAAPILCACCNEQAVLPCWVCVTCSPLTFICDRCDRKNTPVIDTSRNHSLRDHHLLRIHDSIEVKPARLNKGTEVERQLEEISTNISSLEEKVNIQIEDAKEMKTVIEDVAKSVGLNDYDFASSESVLNDVDDAPALEVTGSGPNGNGSREGDDKPPDPEKNDAENDHSQDVNEKPEKMWKSQMDLRERLSAVEIKVESMNQTLLGLARDDRNTEIVNKVDALEAKIDHQFGTLLTLVQNLVSSSRTLPNGPST